MACYLQQQVYTTPIYKVTRTFLFALPYYAQPFQRLFINVSSSNHKFSSEKIVSPILNFLPSGSCLVFGCDHVRHFFLFYFFFWPTDIFFYDYEIFDLIYIHFTIQSKFHFDSNIIEKFHPNKSIFAKTQTQNLSTSPINFYWCGDQAILSQVEI